jgi:hypothetical protein
MADDDYQFIPIDHDPFSQHQSALDWLQSAVTPEWSKPFAGMTPEQEQIEARALADPNAKPGKIGPGYLSDTARAGLGIADLISWLAPEFKGGAALAAMPAAIKPEMVSRLMEMLNAGSSTRQIADELGVGRNAVRGYLDRNSLSTAAMTQPSFWNQSNMDKLKEMAGSGKYTQEQMANEFGIPTNTLQTKLLRMIKNGEVTDYKSLSNSSEPVWSRTDVRERIKQLAKEGRSQSEIASAIKGGPSGKMQTHRGSVSTVLSQMRASGELPDYAPQFGGSAGKTPSMPAYESLKTPAPAADPEAEAAISSAWAKKAGLLGIGGLTSIPVDHDPFAATAPQ